LSPLPGCLLPERCVKAAPEGAGTGWFISALGAAQICSWGTLFYGFPLIAEAMRTDLGWSKTELYGAATVGMLLAGLAAYPVGTAIDRGHGRTLMAGASVAAGLLLAAWSQVQTLVAFYVVLAGLGCMQAATLYEPAFAVIARRVGPLAARKGITALTLWGGFASTVFIPIIQVLIDSQGWRGALLVMAAVNAVVCGGLYFFAIDKRKDAPARIFHPDDAVPLAGRAAVAAAMRKPAYWGLMLAWISYAAAFSSLTYHLYPLLLERGLDAAGVVIVLAVIGPAQVAGRVLIRVFASGAPVRTLGSAIVIVFPLAVIGFSFAPPEVAVIASSPPLRSGERHDHDCPRHGGPGDGHARRIWCGERLPHRSDAPDAGLSAFGGCRDLAGERRLWSGACGDLHRLADAVRRVLVRGPFKSRDSMIVRFSLGY
jgi:MFS family permease